MKKREGFQIKALWQEYSCTFMSDIKRHEAET